MPLRVALRGNFLPGLDADRPPEQRRTPWSTETHLAGSWELLGHEVIRIQENEMGWAETVEACEGADLFSWTSTWGFAHQWDQDEAWAAVKLLNVRLPTISWHLDRFWGLREDQLTQEPWFRTSYCFTADGGNQERFRALNIRHHWLPPAVYEPECVLGEPRDDYRSELAFVGNWRGGYHAESTHRAALVGWLRQRYGPRIKMWPVGEQIRGKDLSDLYASASVVIGDSCFSGLSQSRAYISDRIPESLGRGAFLMHPHTEGVTDGTLYTDGEHLACWDAFDWDRLAVMIDRWLDDPEGRDRIRLAGFEHVKANHTYTNRIAEVLDVLVADGALNANAAT